MLKTKSFLTVDFGAGCLKQAEFETSEAGGLILRNYMLRPLGQEGAIEAKREPVVVKALQDGLAEFGTGARNINLCAPGFHVFSKFVKLPPVDAGKVTQIIQYEAQQNVPFPLAEVVWDYQILGSTPGGELEVLLVAIKSEVVERLFRVTDGLNLSLQVTDVSAAALCNAFRFNYGDLEGCTMLLDIGAKTSNLLFFEKGKVYARSINLGANSITQDFANETKLPFAEAEQIKIAEGFVSLGGAYEEPDNPHQAAISKIARQFMTRLHIQVNQTMQFYRGQQGGSPPDRLFLCGGASVMPYTAQFFAEKINVPVEYLNPFRNVQIDPAVNLENLAKVAHSLGEVVGLALRNLAHCPVELNLMPESTLRWQSFNQKKPYIIATVFSLVAVVFAVGWLFGRSANVKAVQLEDVKQETGPLKQKEVQFKRAYQELTDKQEDLAQLNHWIEGRYHWVDLFGELRKIMLMVEEAGKRNLGADVGLWIERFISEERGPSLSGLFGRSGEMLDPMMGGTMGGYGRGMPDEFGGTTPPGYDRYVATPQEMMPQPGMDPYGVAAPDGYGGAMANPYGAGADPYGMGGIDPMTGQPIGGQPAIDPMTGLPMDPAAGGGMQPVIDPMTGQPMIDPMTGMPMMQPAPGAAGPTGSKITIICRAISLTAVNPTANTDIAFALEKALKNSELFDPQGTSLQGQINVDEDKGIFTFGVTVALKRPLEL